MAKITKPLVIDAQLLEDKVYNKLKKKFFVLNDKTLRRIAHNAVVEYAEKGTNTIVESYFRKESEESCTQEHGKS